MQKRALFFWTFLAVFALVLGISFGIKGYDTWRVGRTDETVAYAVSYLIGLGLATLLDLGLVRLIFGKR